MRIQPFPSPNATTFERAQTNPPTHRSAEDNAERERSSPLGNRSRRDRQATTSPRSLSRGSFLALAAAAPVTLMGVRSGTRPVRANASDAQNFKARAAQPKAPDRASITSFVRSSGAALTLAGAPYRPFFGSSYQARGPAGQIVAAAQQMGLNSVRLTDWFGSTGTIGVVDRDETSWSGVDKLIAALSAAGLKAVLDLSCYRNLLLGNGLNPYIQDWTGFLSFVLKRQNTASGLRYRNDPAIAYVAFAGEVSGPSGGDRLKPSSTQLISFYATVSEYWKHAGGRQLCCPGGWIHLGITNQLGIPVAAIAGLPDIDLIGIHTYGNDDLEEGIPTIARHAAVARKPWVNEEFGQALGDGVSELSRAAWFNSRFTADDTFGCAGEGFWNIGAGSATAGGFDVAPGGATAEAVRARSLSQHPALPPEAPPANLLTGATAEALDVSLFAATAAKIAKDTVLSRSGGSSIQATANGKGNPCIIVANSAAAPTSAGRTVTASVWVLPSHTRTFAARLSWTSSSFAFIAAVDGEEVTCPAKVWTRVTVTETAPEHTIYASMQANCTTSVTQGEIFNIDDLGIATGSVPAT
jgi:hypothetical protein